MKSPSPSPSTTVKTRPISINLKYTLPYPILPSQLYDFLIHLLPFFLSQSNPSVQERKSVRNGNTTPILEPQHQIRKPLPPKNAGLGSVQPRPRTLQHLKAAHRKITGCADRRRQTTILARQIARYGTTASAFKLHTRQSPLTHPPFLRIKPPASKPTPNPNRDKSMVNTSTVKKRTSSALHSIRSQDNNKAAGEK